MELFDKKFVHFMWNDSLEGKVGFYSDNIGSLIKFVDCNSKEYTGCVKHNCMNDAYPFNIVQSGNSFQFFYYDPNYECKVAYAQGKQIQYKPKDSSVWWADCVFEPEWVDTCEYRVKPEKTWRPFKNIQELKQAWDAKRSPLVHPELEEHTIWVRDKECHGITRLITDFSAGSKSVALAGNWCILEALFDDYEFLDGTPCGVEEVE